MGLVQIQRLLSDFSVCCKHEGKIRFCKSSVASKELSQGDKRERDLADVCRSTGELQKAKPHCRKLVESWSPLGISDHSEP